MINTILDALNTIDDATFNKIKQQYAKDSARADREGDDYSTGWKYYWENWLDQMTRTEFAEEIECFGDEWKDIVFNTDQTSQ